MKLIHQNKRDSQRLGKGGEGIGLAKGEISLLVPGPKGPLPILSGRCSTRP